MGVLSCVFDNRTTVNRTTDNRQQTTDRRQKTKEKRQKTKDKQTTDKRQNRQQKTEQTTDRTDNKRQNRQKTFWFFESSMSTTGLNPAFILVLSCVFDNRTTVNRTTDNRQQTT